MVVTVGLASLLGVDVPIAVVVAVAVLSVAVVLLIVVSPWGRDEPGLSEEAEARILMRRDPDLGTGEVPRVDDAPFPAEGDPASSAPDGGTGADWDSLTDGEDEPRDR
jgi:hypothetical protein